VLRLGVEGNTPNDMFSSSLYAPGAASFASAEESRTVALTVGRAKAWPSSTWTLLPTFRRTGAAVETAATLSTAVLDHIGEDVKPSASSDSVIVPATWAPGVLVWPRGIPPHDIDSIAASDIAERTKSQGGWRS
jgi:hypothetical protein